MTSEELQNSAECERKLKTLQNHLDAMLTPGGSAADVVNVPLTKEQIAMLLSVIDGAGLL